MDIKLSKLIGLTSLVLFIIIMGVPHILLNDEHLENSQCMTYNILYHSNISKIATTNIMTNYSVVDISTYKGLLVVRSKFYIGSTIYVNPYNNTISPSTLISYMTIPITDLDKKYYAIYNHDVPLFKPNSIKVFLDGKYLYIMGNIIESRYRTYNNNYPSLTNCCPYYTTSNPSPVAIGDYATKYSYYSGTQYYMYGLLTIIPSDSFNNPKLGDQPLLRYKTKIYTSQNNYEYVDRYVYDSVKGFTILKVDTTTGKIVWGRTFYYGEYTFKGLTKGYVSYNNYGIHPTDILIYEPLLLYDYEMNISANAINIIGIGDYNGTKIFRITINSDDGGILSINSYDAKYQSLINKESDGTYLLKPSVTINGSQVNEEITTKMTKESIILTRGNYTLEVTNDNNTKWFTTAIKITIIDNVNSKIVKQVWIGKPNINIFLSPDTLIQKYNDSVIFSLKILSTNSEFLSPINGFILASFNFTKLDFNWIKYYQLPTSEQKLHFIMSNEILRNATLFNEIITNITNKEYYFGLLSNTEIVRSLFKDNKIELHVVWYTISLKPLNNIYRRMGKYDTIMIFHGIGLNNLTETINTKYYVATPILLPYISQSEYFIMMIDPKTGSVDTTNSYQFYKNGSIIDYVNLDGDDIQLVELEPIGVGTLINSIITINSCMYGFCETYSWWCCSWTYHRYIRGPIYYDKLLNFTKLLGLYTYANRLNIYSGKIFDMGNVGIQVVRFEDTNFKYYDIDLINR